MTSVAMALEHYRAKDASTRKSEVGMKMSQKREKTLDNSLVSVKKEMTEGSKTRV